VFTGAGKYDTNKNNGERYYGDARDGGMAPASRTTACHMKLSQDNTPRNFHRASAY